MSYDGPKLEEWQHPASAADIKHVSGILQGIWESEHMMAEQHRFRADETTWLGYQNFGKTDIDIGFQPKTASYPEMAVRCEETEFDTLDDADLVLGSMFRFVPGRKRNGLMRYRALNVVTTLNIENAAGNTTGSANIPAQEQPAGRKWQREEKRASVLMVAHIGNLSRLLMRYDPTLAAFHSRKETEH